MNSLIKKPKQKSVLDSQKILLEFIGTFSLTYVASWTLIFKDLHSITYNGVGLAQALTLAGFIWFGLYISGAHYNPAVTISLVLIKQIDWYTAMFYIGSQFLGGLVSSAFIYIQLNSDIIATIKEKSVMGIPRPANLNFDVSSLWGEILGTYLLMYVYMATCSPANTKRVPGIGGAAVGFAFYIVSMTVGELSGSGLNPARSLGPAIIAGKIEKDQFVHFFGPIIGAVVATLFYKWIYIEDEEDLKEEEQEKQLKETQTNLISSNDQSEFY